jgi:hypothetical protein
MPNSVTLIKSDALVLYYSSVRFIPYIAIGLAFLNHAVKEAAGQVFNQRVEVRLEQGINTRTARAGDPITGVLDEGLRSGSQILLPRGTRLEGKIESVQSGNRNTHGWMRLLFDEVVLPDGRRVRAQFSNLFSAGDRHVLVRYILPLGAGAATGAVIGGEKARVSGMLGGLVVGSVISFGRPRAVRDVEFDAGRRVSLRLGQDLQIPTVE